MYKSVAILGMVLLFAVSCGGGGGGSSAPTNPNRYSTKDVETYNLTGKWYICSYAMNGTQYMTNPMREASVTVNKDGSWYMDMWISDNSGKLVNSVASSEESSVDKFKINSFTYLVSQNSMKITESVTYVGNSSPTSISYVMIREGNDDNLIGNYYLTSGLYATNGVVYGAGDLFKSYTLSILGNTHYETIVYHNNSTTNESFPASYRDGFVFELFATDHKNNIGTYSYNNGILKVNITEYDGSIQELTFKKI